MIPWLRTYPFIRIWHAGCATGEEVYSMAILLEEEGLYDRCRIYATELSEVVLHRARLATYSLAPPAEVHQPTTIVPAEPRISRAITRPIERTR